MVQGGKRTSDAPAAVRSPRSWLVAMTVIGLVGGGLAISQADDPRRLIRMPLSNLGVDRGSAAIMTATLVGLGITLLALGVSLDRAFARLRSAGRLSPFAAWLIRVEFVVAGMAVAVTGLVPNRVGLPTAFHNFAGFTFPLVLMMTMVGARLALGPLGRQFDLLSAFIGLSVVVLFAVTHWVHVLPYSLMELICFVLIGAWLWLFEARLRSLLAELRPRRRPRTNVARQRRHSVRAARRASG